MPWIFNTTVWISQPPCPETSAINYQPTLRKIPKERISYLHHVRSLKSRNCGSIVFCYQYKSNFHPPMGPLLWCDFRIQDIIWKCTKVRTVTGSVLAHDVLLSFSPICDSPFFFSFAFHCFFIISPTFYHSDLPFFPWFLSPVPLLLFPSGCGVFPPFIYLHLPSLTCVGFLPCIFLILSPLSYVAVFLCFVFNSICMILIYFLPHLLFLLNSFHRFQIYICSCIYLPSLYSLVLCSH